MRVSRFPPYLRKSLLACGSDHRVKKQLERLNLSTVCQSARCPNRNECFSKGTATFMLLGEICTRDCRFCAVNPGKPAKPEPSEPRNIALAVKNLDLKYVVLTSVTRDDLPDGGALHFFRTIKAIHSETPLAKIEALVPDFMGNLPSLKKALSANIDVLNHNVETVPRLYPKVRPGARYKRSLELLENASRIDPSIVTKSGLMLGMGETPSELMECMKDLRRVNCKILTLGQYLPPGKKYYPLHEYIPPEKFDEYRDLALSLGFVSVVSGPFVRSSYNARKAWEKNLSEKKEKL